MKMILNCMQIESKYICIITLSNSLILKHLLVLKQSTNTIKRIKHDLKQRHTKTLNHTSCLDNVRSIGTNYQHQGYRKDTILYFTLKNTLLMQVKLNHAIITQPRYLVPFHPISF